MKKLPYLGTPVSDARLFGWRKSGVQQLRCRRRSDGPGAPPALGHSSGHRQSTRVRCRIVSLMRGLCLTALANSSCAFFKAAAGVEHALDFHAVFGPLLNLIEIAIVRAERIVGLLVAPIVIHGGRVRWQQQAMVLSAALY